MLQTKNTAVHATAAALLSATLLLPSGSASAAPRFGEDTLNLKLGAFLSDFDTTVSASGPNGGGGEVNLEDVLGLDSDQTSFRGELMWRFAPRHRLILGYYRFDRDSSVTAQRDFEWQFENGDVIQVTAGAKVEGTFDWQLVPVSYAYSFYKSQNMEVAGSVGLHWVDLKLGIAGQLVLNGTPVSAGSEAQSTSGPLPVFGLRADYAITPKWLVGGHAQYFGLDYDDYSGNLLDLRLQTEYWFTDHVGAGIGYTWYDIDLAEDLGSGFELAVDYTYRGVEAYVGFRF